MERNLDRRVETLCPITDPVIAAHLRQVVLDAYLRDTKRAYVLEDRTYRRVDAGARDAFGAQQCLLQSCGALVTGEEASATRVPPMASWSRE